VKLFIQTEFIIMLISCNFCIILVFCAVAESAPTIEETGSELVALEGAVVQFLCNASGEPAPFFLWSKNGVIIPTRNSRCVKCPFNLSTCRL